MSIIRTANESVLKNSCTGNTFLVEVLIPLAGNQEKPHRQSPIYSLQRMQNLNYFIFSQNQASPHTAPLLPLPPDPSSRFPASFLEGLGYFYCKQAVLSIVVPSSSFALLLQLVRQQKSNSQLLIVSWSKNLERFLCSFNTEFRHSCI